MNQYSKTESIKFGLIKVNGVKVKVLLESLTQEFYLFKKPTEELKEKYNKIIFKNFENNSDFVFLFGQFNESLKTYKLKNHKLIMNKKYFEFLYLRNIFCFY